MSTRLAWLAERARESGRIGLDTEFVSERRYKALLCLVQIAVQSEEGLQIEVIDALSDVDPQPLVDVLADPSVEVVVHAGRQDIALLRRSWGAQVRNVFDTQIAAAFVGSGIQAGYETLLNEILGVRVKKSASFTHWDRRPLTQEQLAYAGEDVDRLLELATVLHSRLEARGRVEWAAQESLELESSTDERNLEEVFRRLPRVASLGGRGAAVARELVYWREERARKEDRPVGWVLGDPALIEVARRRPADVKKLNDIRGLHEASIRRHGRDLIEAVKRAENAEPIKLERPRPPTQEPPSLVALSEALVRSRAEEEQIAYQLIAARAELTEIATAVMQNGTEPNVRTLTGWRRELVGEELLELLRGRRTLSVGPEGRLSSDARDER
jgi:ribonuclease D